MRNKADKSEGVPGVVVRPVVMPPYPMNKAQMNELLAQQQRGKWMRRLIVWPLIIAAGIGVDIILCQWMDLTEQSARLIMGLTVGSLTASALRLAA